MQLIQRTFAMLDAFADDRGLGLSQIARAAGIRRTTAANIVRALVAEGVLRKTPDRRYHLGDRLAPLAEAVRGADDLQAAGRSEAVRLCRAVNENVTVAAIRGDKRVKLAQVEADRTLAIDPHRLDTRLSIYESATGRVLMAWADAAARRRLRKCEGSPGGRWPGVKTVAELNRALDGIREAGRAEVVTTDGDVVMIARPVLDDAGRARAAIGVSAPAFRCKGRHRKAVEEALHSAARHLARSQGWAR